MEAHDPEEGEAAKHVSQVGIHLLETFDVDRLHFLLVKHQIIDDIQKAPK